MQTTVDTSAADAPVGIFDSGLGGLTVAAAIRRILPDEQIVYLGDTARVPYGTRSLETVRHFAVQDAEFLMHFRVKAIVAACNTVSSQALDTLRKKFPDTPIIGVIDPGVRAAIRFGAKSAVVIGTKGTIRSGAYERALRELAPDMRVRSIACPLLVPFAEEGILEGPAVREVLRMYLGELLSDPPDLLIPGCTHYPLFHAALRAFLHKETQIADCAEACALALKDFLQTHALSAREDARGCLRCYVTDFVPDFQLCAERFLGYSPKYIKKAELF